MFKKLTIKMKAKFSSLETTLKSIIFALIPLMTFFLIMSDRKPYNSLAFILYGIETLLILFFIIKYHKFVFDVFSLLLGFFVLTVLISQLTNFTLIDFPRTILLLSIFGIIFYQFLITLNEEEKHNVYKLIILGGIFFAIYFIIYYFDDVIHLRFNERLGGDFSDQNDLAKNLAIFVILSEIFIIKVKGKNKIIYIISTFLFLVLMLLTGSISNLLVLIVLSAALLFYMTKGKQRIFVTIAIFAMFLLFIVSLQLPFMSYFRTRLINMYNLVFSESGKIDHSFLERTHLAMYGLRLFISKPIFGYGYNQVQFYTMGKDAFSHNNFIELLASFGILGFAAFEILLLYPIIKNWKKQKKELAVFSLLYIFVFQTFLIVFRKKIEYFLIPLAFSLIDYPIYKCYTLSFKNKKIYFSKKNYSEPLLSE